VYRSIFVSSWILISFQEADATLTSVLTKATTLYPGDLLSCGLSRGTLPSFLVFQEKLGTS
jgi:hypothetical protein